MKYEYHDQKANKFEKEKSIFATKLERREKLKFKGWNTDNDIKVWYDDSFLDIPEINNKKQLGPVEGLT